MRYRYAIFIQASTNSNLLTPDRGSECLSRRIHMGPVGHPKPPGT